MNFLDNAIKGVDPSFFQRRNKLTNAERIAEWRSSNSTSGIGDLPTCKDPGRRKSCSLDFRLFCETYKPLEFSLDWSDDHLKVIEKLERVILKSELYSIAMPRGSGKTTLAESAVLWAALYGHTKYVVLIGADSGSAQDSLSSIKTDLETNEILEDDFPEVCIPIKKLDGLAQRAKAQKQHGEPTKIHYSSEKVIFPTLRGYEGTAGTIMECRGLTARIRGLKHKLETGESIRPDLCIIDDPQTDASAASESQNEKRVGLLKGAILNLAGPGKEIRAIMPCTVIERGDMADQILDRNKNPRWQGDRMKAVYSFPTNEKLWEEYGLVWREGLANEDGGKAGLEFYKANREAMDEGAVVAWEGRVKPGDVSAIQTCMNMKIEDEETFMAEMQNEPPDPLDDPENSLHKEGLELRSRDTSRRLVPTEAGRLIAFVDVGSESGLAWGILALNDNYSSTLIDYGIKDVPYKNRGIDPKVAIWDKLTELCSELDVDYQNEQGENMRLTQLGIDAGWESDTIYRFCRESPHRGILIPTKGAFVRPGTKLYGMSDKAAMKGQEWIYATVKSATRPVKLFRFNANWWKTFAFNRLRASMGADGALGFCKGKHKDLIMHLTSEFRQKVVVEGKVYDQWNVRPNRPNHLWDCVVGCLVLANFTGIDTMMRGRADISTNGRRKKRVYK